MSGCPHILVIGASGRFVAASALAAGYAVSVADLFGDADTRRICKQSSQFLGIEEEPIYPQALRIKSLQSLTQGGRKLSAENEKRFLELEALKTQAVIFTGGAENYPEFFDSRFLQNARVAGPAVKSIKRLLSLKAVNQVCHDCKIQRPKTICSRNFMLHQMGSNRSWLRKQIRSGGGLQTRRWDGVSAIEFEAGEYLQSFCEGDTVSGCFISIDRANQAKEAKEGDDAKEADEQKTVLLGVCVQHANISINDFRYRGSVGTILLPQHDYLEMQRVGQCIAEAFQLVGVFGIDFIRSEEGLCLIDINPRIPASSELIERTRRMTEPNFTIVAAHLNACLQNRLPKPIDILPSQLYSKTIVYLPDNQRLKVNVDLMKYFESRSYITDLPDRGSEVEPNHPLVTVHAEAKDHQSLLHKSARRIEELWQHIQARRASE